MLYMRVWKEAMPAVALQDVRYNYLSKVYGCAIPKLATEVTKLMTSIAVGCSLRAWK